MLEPERRPTRAHRRRDLLTLVLTTVTLIILAGAAQARNVEVEALGSSAPIAISTAGAGNDGVPGAVVTAQLEYQASRLGTLRPHGAFTSSEECFTGFECQTSDERLAR